MQYSKYRYIVFIFLGLIYTIFQTQNAMIDSWYYASCVKFKHELFNSHHLIYNIIGFYWFSLLKLIDPSIEAISSLNLMNGIAATGCLFALNTCLIKLRTEIEVSFWLTLFCGISFGFMRYATDAETYVLPLLFSLLSTSLFINNKNKKHLLLSGFFATISILIHQLHIWWSAAMFLFLLIQKPFKIKDILLFSCPFLILPFTYYITFIEIENNPITFIQFITGEYSKGNASIDISFRSFLLTIINFIRTFIQIHGQIGFLFRTYFFIGCLTIGTCIGILLTAYYKNSIKFILIKKTTDKNFNILFLMAFLLHFSFAFLSSGNAEFMVMLPFLLVLFLVTKYQFKNSGLLKYITLLIFIWNFNVAILPNACLKINQVTNQVEITKKNPEAFFLWKNKPLVENNLTYKQGFNHSVNFIDNTDLRGRLLDSLLEEKKLIYTDIPNTATDFSRESLLSEINRYKIIKHYHLKPVDSFDNLYGKKYIYLLQ